MGLEAPRGLVMLMRQTVPGSGEASALSTMSAWGGQMVYTCNIEFDDIRIESIPRAGTGKMAVSPHTIDMNNSVTQAVVSIYNELTTIPKFNMVRLGFELRLKNNNKTRLNKNGTVYKGSATEILSKATL